MRRGEVVSPAPHRPLCRLCGAVVHHPQRPRFAVARFDQATGWYLLQGLIWPVAGAVGAWRVWFAALSNPAWAPLIIAAPITLVLLFVAYWRGRKLPLFFFGLIWYTRDGTAHLGNTRLRLRGHFAAHSVCGGGRRGVDLGGFADARFSIGAGESLVESDQRRLGRSDSGAKRVVSQRPQDPARSNDARHLGRGQQRARRR